MPVYARDAPICGGDQLSFGFPVAARIMAAEIALLTPEMANGFALTDFVSNPPRLHIVAVKARKIIAFNLSFDFAFVPKPYHRLN
jgi:hypothetical protein